MKKFILVVMLVSCAHAFALNYLGSRLFHNETITSTLTPMTSKVVEIYNMTSIDYAVSGDPVKGVFVGYVSNDASRWYALTKDASGATVTMAPTATASDAVNFGNVPYRFFKLVFTPDSVTATGGVINSAYMTKE